MRDYQVLWRVRLGKGHVPTGRTQHLLGGAPAPIPAELRIVQYADDQGCYLFYCDESGKEFTDTYHESVDEAKAQAKWEFEVDPEEWERCR